MTQTNEENKCLFYAIDDLTLGRAGLTVRKSMENDAKKFLWDIKLTLSTTFHSGTVQEILSDDFDRIRTTSTITSYASKFKSNLALLKLEQGTDTPPPPARLKRNVIISYSEATQAKKVRTSSPERIGTGDLDQRLNQLHLATTSHTKSAVEILEHKLEDIKEKQQKFEETITATLKKVTRIHAEKVQNMINQQNQDIHEAVENIRKRHKEAEELQQEKILGVIGDQMQTQMTNLVTVMLTHMDKKFEQLEQNPKPGKRQMLLPPSPAKLLKQEKDPMETENPDKMKNVLTQSQKKEAPKSNGETLGQGSGH